MDKATPSRTTNQAVLVVARENNGIPCPIPVAAPPVHSAFTEATYDDLARQLLKAVSEHFSQEVLSRLCGIAADGPYQATGFAAQLRESLGMELNDELAMPVIWGAAHLLNLGNLLHPRRSKEEEWQYMIAGSDFVTDLLGFLDIMDTVIDLMLRAQALDTPIWKLKLWWTLILVWLTSTWH